MEPHKIIVFCAPSGAGKTTLARRVMELLPKLAFSVSATNRPMRDYEKDGVDYHFLTEEAFKQKAADNEFIEWEEVYPGRVYGTLKSEVDRLEAAGSVPVFDIDVKGALNLKKIYGDDALIIFVKAPMDIIRERLISRNTETPESLQARIDRAKEELEYESMCDVTIENIDLEKAVGECTEVVSKFLEK